MSVIIKGVMNSEKTIPIVNGMRSFAGGILGMATMGFYQLDIFRKEAEANQKIMETKQEVMEANQKIMEAKHQIQIDEIKAATQQQTAEIKAEYAKWFWQRK
jgi:heterodisulfide reductase subunit C